MRKPIQLLGLVSYFLVSSFSQTARAEVTPANYFTACRQGYTEVFDMGDKPFGYTRFLLSDLFSNPFADRYSAAHTVPIGIPGWLHALLYVPEIGLTALTSVMEGVYEGVKIPFRIRKLFYYKYRTNFELMNEIVKGHVWNDYDLERDLSWKYEGPQFKKLLAALQKLNSTVTEDQARTAIAHLVMSKQAFCNEVEPKVVFQAPGQFTSKILEEIQRPN